LPAKFRVTNPERVIDASTGITKVELVRYYGLVGKLMLEHLKGHPVSLVRAPAGVGGELFFQKHAEVERLPGVRQLPRDLYPSHPEMLEVFSTQGLLSAAQWNVIEFHTLNTSSKSFEHPDRMIFDLDPGEGVTWPHIQEAAELMHSFLDQLGLVPFLKTSGGKGLHVVVPLRKVHDWDTVKDFSQAVVDHVAKTIPQRFVAKSGAKNRVGKIFIDYLRNGLGATTACAWSARARPGLGISVPCDWSAHTRLDKGNEPWAAYAKSARSLNASMKLLDFKP
jgi:bifunctional non-homologous end joining protein LigD